MAPWFPEVDDAVGGVADQFENSADWVLGGFGDAAANTAGGGADVVTSGVGGVFGPLMNSWLKIAALVLGAVLVWKVI